MSSAPLRFFTFILCLISFFISLDGWSSKQQKEKKPSIAKKQKILPQKRKRDEASDKKTEQPPKKRKRDEVSDEEKGQPPTKKIKKEETGLSAKAVKNLLDQNEKGDVLDILEDKDISTSTIQELLAIKKVTLEKELLSLLQK